MSNVIWKRWMKDTRTLQRRCKRDGYQMLVSLKISPVKFPRKAVKP